MYWVILCGLSCTSLSTLLVHVLSSGDSASSPGRLSQPDMYPIHLIFSLISPSFSQLHGFVPHGSSVLIFFIVQNLQLIILYLQQNITAQWFCISTCFHEENEVSKPIFSSSSSLLHFNREVPNTYYNIVYLHDLNCADRASSFPVLKCIHFSVYTTRQIRGS